MPAKAGIHDLPSSQQRKSWIPAFAGMTGWAQHQWVSRYVAWYKRHPAQIGHETTIGAEFSTAPFVLTCQFSERPLSRLSTRIPDGPISLRVFGRLPKAVGGAPMAGVRKASREETAGRFAMALVQAYGDLRVAPDGFSMWRIGLNIRWSMGELVVIDGRASAIRILCRRNVFWCSA